MPITLGSNIASLRGQSGLNKVTNELRSVYERLSSGLRINRASDDSAGLAVSESLKADTRIYSQAIRNVNDGVSLLSITDAALENLSTVVMRLQELAEQSSNGVYSSKQREALDAEAQALAKEFTRIQQTTSFNGISLLNGDLESLQIQAGIGLSAILDLGVGGAVGTGAFGGISSSIAVASQNQSLNLFDINGDGINDLIAIQGGADIINVRMGNGDGSFGSAATYSVDPNAVSIAMADFNGDGHQDIVTANGASYGILLGQGDGTFGAVTNTNGTISDNIAIGDVNGDGILDLVSNQSGSSILSVFLGNGNGTFQSSINTNTGTNIAELALADFNGDGILDIATGQALGGNLNIYNGNGNGSFGASAQTLALVGTSVSELLAIDLNNDGMLDLVSSDQGSSNLKVFLNHGNGTFDSGTQYFSNAGAFQLATGDFNGDGYQDLVAGHGAGYSVLLNQGNGTFGTATRYNSASNFRFGLVTGDINQDGVLDVMGSSGTSTVSTLGTTTDGVAPILEFSLKTIADAKQALSMLKNKATLLAKQRGEVGAYQARLEVTNNVLTTSRENFDAAAARIKDADIAEDSAKLIRNRILQQAASSILAQANTQPELALKLLS